MSEELKPCPYCGEPFNITKIGEGEWLRYFVKHNGYCLMAYHFENVVGYTDIDLVTKELNTRPIEDALQAKLDVAVDKLHEIDNWAKAYPLEVFPEPDWQKAKELLGSNLLTCISASNMRHVIDGVSNIVSEALNRLEE